VRTRTGRRAGARAPEKRFLINHFEILVVDNGSTDGTREMVFSRFGGHNHVPVRYIREETPGLSRARNRAIDETTSEFLVFLDDDAIPMPGWLAAIAGVFASSSDIAVVGGEMVPVYEGGKPPWLPLEAEHLFMPMIPGEGLRRISYPHYPYGANIAFRRRVFRQAGQFREDLGYCASALVPSEETELLVRAENTGAVIMFEPKAAVEHHVLQDRLSKQYIRRRFLPVGVGYYEIHKTRCSDTGNWGFREIADGLRMSILALIALRGRIVCLRRKEDKLGFAEELKCLTQVGWHRARFHDALHQLWVRIRSMRAARTPERPPPPS